MLVNFNRLRSITHSLAIIFINTKSRTFARPKKAGFFYLHPSFYYNRNYNCNNKFNINNLGLFFAN